MGSIFFLITGIFTHITAKYLVNAAEEAGCFAYRELCSVLFGPIWGYIIPFVVMLYVSGSLMSYTVAIQDNMYWW